MGGVIFQGVVILAIVIFLTYLAYDDRRNTRLREEEDKARLLKQDQNKEKP